MFGRRGAPPTEFEVALLARCADCDDRWVAVGKRIGAEALFAVLDELGGEILSAPSREMFVLRLYQPHRDAEMLELATAGVPTMEIARTYGVNENTVRRAVARALRTCPRESARNTA